MLVSFTQTYGDKRLQLIDIYSKDKKLHELKNLCDLNIYSFHNSSDSTVLYFKDRNPVSNTDIIRFNNSFHSSITYPQCIEQLLYILEKINCTHFLFIQDDTFSNNNEDVDFEEFISFVKEYKENFMYCFFYTHEWFKNELPILKKLKTLTIYENDTINYYLQTPHGGMNDYPYICTFDIFKRLYDKLYFKIPDIWNAEGYLNKKFSAEKMIRHNGNKSLFDNYNIVGRNIWNRVNDINRLKAKNLY